MAIHYFPLRLIFSLSTLCCYRACTRWDVCMASAQQTATQEQFPQISGNSAVILTNTGVNIQEVIWVLERQTGLPILLQVTTRYKLYRHLLNEALPLNERVSQSTRGNSRDKVLVVCEGIIKCTSFMRLQPVWSRCMQPALYS